LTPNTNINAPQSFRGHPRGVYVLASTELFERISFHGMQALLVLYLVGHILVGETPDKVWGLSGLRAGIESLVGPLSVQATAAQIFGLYIGFVFFLPILGGVIGDRFLGRVRAVSLGAGLMVLGHLSLAFDESFLIGLCFLMVGAGFLRGNLTPQIGELYARDDPRRPTAYQIYGSMVNLGAFVAPILTGAIGQAYGWHAGFASAAFAMSIALVVFLTGRRSLPEAAQPVQSPTDKPNRTGEGVRRDRQKILLLVMMVPLVTCFWVAQTQVWNTYNIWVRDHLEMHLGSFDIPIPWLQSLDGVAPLIALTPMLMFWRWQHRRGREPDEFGKLAIGAALFGLGTLLLALSSLVEGEAARIPLFWAIGFHVISNLGWLYFVPTAYAIYSRAAPLSVAATMFGVNSISISLGSVVSGRLGGFYEALSPPAFWGIHAIIVTAGGLALFLYGRAFKRILFSPRLD
jgi:POT family proton-dependent oligopeptide transporter